MKVNVNVAVAIGLAASAVGWAITVENRLATQAEALNLSNRVRAMEELMLPMLIDWKTHKELRKWQQNNIDKIKGEVDKGNKPKAAPLIVDEEVPAAVRHKVDNWARSVFKNPDEPDGTRLAPVAQPKSEK